MKKLLSQDEIKKISSEYLSGGIGQDVWQIQSVSIDGENLEAVISMVSTYCSPTDEGGFHLSASKSLEIISQLVIVYMHAWAGLSEKTKEVWMIDSSIKCSSPIRSQEEISVSMQVGKIRNSGSKTYISTSSKLSDAAGGLFEINLTAFSS